MPPKIKAAVKIKAAAEKIKAAAEKIKAPVPNPDKIKAAEKIKAELPTKIKALLGIITDALEIDDATKNRMRDRVTEANSLRIMDDVIFSLIEKCGCYVALPEDYEDLNSSYDDIRTEVENLERENNDLRSIAARLKMANDALIEGQQDETLRKQNDLLIDQNKELLATLRNGQLFQRLRTFKILAEQVLKKYNVEFPEVDEK